MGGSVPARAPLCALTPSAPCAGTHLVGGCRCLRRSQCRTRRAVGDAGPSPADPARRGAGVGSGRWQRPEGREGAVGLGGAGADSLASGNTNPFPGSPLLLQTALARQPSMAAPSGCPKGWTGPEVMLGQSTRSQNSPAACLGSSSPPRASPGPGGMRRGATRTLSPHCEPQGSLHPSVGVVLPGSSSAWPACALQSPPRRISAKMGQN